MKISIIIPFYKGNEYLERLFTSINNVSTSTNETFEVIIVNDNPGEKVLIPQNKLNVLLIENENNLGIQGTRINGIKNSTGDWILMLDQDDELVEEGFKKQIELTKNANVVVGNGTYILGDVNKTIYKNLKSMNYLIKRERFIEIRNLIPSPGECLIRKECIPSIWMDNRLINNGADDWMLWLLLFGNGARFSCNELPVYIHNDTSGKNLSANLAKMRESSLEMAKIVYSEGGLTTPEFNTLICAINFKYLQDNKQLSISKIWRLRTSLISNIKYRLKLGLIYRW